jgi:hypothetical protein
MHDAILGTHGLALMSVVVDPEGCILLPAEVMPDLLSVSVCMPAM